MSKISLKELQQIELSVLKQIIEICEKHDLTYYALGGTLLGAVRHKGFIPWDDDIDIGMPRPDYEKFMEIAPLELKDPYMITSICFNNAEYYYYYVRVVDNSIKLQRNISMKSVVINAWVDVFPLDGVPEKPAAFNAWYKKANWLKRLFEFSQYEYYFKFYNTDKKGNKGYNPIKTGIKKLIRDTKVYKVINKRIVWKVLDKLLKSNDFDDSTRLFNFCGCWGLKELFPKQYYGEGAFYTFEDILIRGPVNYDAVLTQMYGDYMTPPKSADRNHHYIDLL